MQGTRVDNLLRELRAHMPQLEKACVATKTQCSQTKDF